MSAPPPRRGRLAAAATSARHPGGGAPRGSLEPPADVDLAGLRRLPMGARAKTGPWGLGSLLLGWALAAWVISGFDRTPLAWTITALLAGVLLSAPHAWAWIRDGVAPIPPPPDGDTVIADRLGLLLLFTVLVRWPTALGDALLTPLWNLVGRRRAERTWLRRTAELRADLDHAVREAEDGERDAPRGRARAERGERRRLVQDEEPVTAELGRSTDSGRSPERSSRGGPGSGAWAPAGREPPPPRAGGLPRAPGAWLDEDRDTDEVAPAEGRVLRRADPSYAGIDPELRDALGGGSRSPRTEAGGRWRRLARRLQLVRGPAG